MNATTDQTRTSHHPALTWPHELADVVQRISAGWRRGDMGRLPLWTGIFLARHACTTGANRTLEDVGKQFGLTRERVRQICEHILGAIKSAQPPMPITTTIVDRLGQLTPIGEVEANEQLRSLIGRKEVAKMAASGALRHVNRLFADLRPGDVIGCRWQTDALHFTPAERAPSAQSAQAIAS